MRSARPARNARWPHTVAVVGIVLAILAGASAVGAQVLVDRWAGSVGQEHLLDPGARDDGAGGPDAPAGAPGDGQGVAGPLTYLVVGTDSTGDDDGGDGAGDAGGGDAGDDGGDAGGGVGPGSGTTRTDAIVIVHLDAELRQGYLLSVPRDLLVHIPGHGTDKINAAYDAGGGGQEGIQLLSRTLRDATGIRFDGAAVIDFYGFESVIDALGGVELCLENSVTSIHTGDTFPTGCQRLDGSEALDLSRQRYGLPEGDFDRGRNHQRLLRAMVDQARSSGLLTDPARLDRTVRAVGGALTVDTGGVPLPELAMALRHLRADQLTGVTLPASSQERDGTWYVVAEPAAAELYQAVRRDQVGPWLDDHPRWHNE